MTSTNKTASPNGGGGHGAPRRRTLVRPRDQYIGADRTGTNSHAQLYLGNGNSVGSGSPTLRVNGGVEHNNYHRPAPQSPTMAHGGAMTGGANMGRGWKRCLLVCVAGSVVLWMSLMTLLVAKLASEQQESGSLQPHTPNRDANINANTGESSSIRGGGGGEDTDVTTLFLRNMASAWRRMRCGRPCWGRTYTYTEPRTGAVVIAAVERIRVVGGGGSSDDADDAAGPWPRGPIFYATPSMLPYSAPPRQQEPSRRRSVLQAQWTAQGALDPMLRVPLGEEAAPQDHDRQPHVQGDCVPMKEWQVSSFPNCNVFHELDIMGMGRNGTDVAFHNVMKTRGDRERSSSNEGRRRGGLYHMEEDAVSFLGRGWFRAAWKVDFGLEDSYPVVLKTLRLEREFYDEYYELHRKDAVAMERLTPSPYVIDIYGFCGQSAINELADFFEDFTNLQAFARQLGGNNDEHLLRLKLQICIMMALGVGHMHEIEGPNNATMVHYDVNPKNVAIVQGGKPKLNDFNTVEFLRWDRVKQRRCGFRGRLHEPWWRAPEELVMPESYAMGKNITSSDAIVATLEDQPLLDEKIDVWSLGNLIYNMLTGHAARGQAKTWRYAEVRRDVLSAKMPWRPTDAIYLNSTQPAIVAMRRAVEQCIVKDPKKRWSALDVAYEMMDTLEMILEEKSNQTATNGTVIAKPNNGTVTAKPNNISVIVGGGESSHTEHTSHNRTMTKKRNESIQAGALASRRHAKQVGELTN